MLKFLRYVSLILVLIGAFNWGLVGVYRFDLVARIFGDMTLPTRVIYSLIGLSAIFTGVTSYICYKLSKTPPL